MRVARRTFVLLLTAGMLVGTLGAAAEARIHPLERRMARVVNQERASKGLRPLQLSRRATHRARHHSGDMSRRFLLYHSCDRCRYGENVGLDESVRAMHRAFMNSPHHRSNILLGRYDEIGIGIVRDGNWIWVTEMFLL